MKALWLTLFFSITVFAGQEGGGGGGICTPRGCITLAEAGLRINTLMTRNFRIGNEQRSDLEALINLIPAKVDKKILLRNALGEKDTFKVVEKKDEIKFEKFKKEYMKILAEEGMTTENFELLAATKDKTTYILPGYERLNTRSKSLILIHEALIRQYGASVREAIKFEGELLDYIQLLSENRQDEFNTVPLENLALDLKMGAENFTHEYKMLTSFDTHLFIKHTPAEIDKFFIKKISPKLYTECVSDTKDEKLCELLPETLITRRLGNILQNEIEWEEHDAQLKMRYLKSDKQSRDKVHFGDTGLWYYWNSTEESIIASLKIKAIEAGMESCINKAKDPGLCQVQDKTFQYVIGEKVLIDGIIKREYSAKILVVQMRK